jgi:prepilin-type N-terminal cleavage/methylation domain-containing protein
MSAIHLGEHNKCYSQRRRRAPARGFTLVELMAAMTAGLVVAGGVVSLSRTATTTFQEESRATSAEMTLRIAAERLRADLARASYMSTPNVRIDPALARPKGFSTNQVGLAFPNGLAALAGIRYEVNGSVNADPVVSQYSLVNGLNPDSIVLGGNFTSADEFIVQTLLDSGPEGCGGKTARLSLDSSAVLRLTHAMTGVAKPAAEAEQSLRDAFVPIPGPAGAAFMARFVDESGKSQIVSLCPGKPPTFDAATGIGVVPLDTATTPLLTSLETGARGGASGFSVGRATLNPVQLVRWSLRRRADAQLDAQDIATTPQNEANARFELVRTWLNISGAPASVNAEEVIAEYIVDLEFAFSVDDPTAGANRQTNFGFGDEGNKAWGQLTTLAMTAATNIRPDRIRSVRFRMASRTAIPDRDSVLAGPAAGYVFRYCLNTGGCANRPQEYARVRTLVSEVSLPNQGSLP